MPTSLEQLLALQDKWVAPSYPTLGDKSWEKAFKNGTPLQCANIANCWLSQFNSELHELLGTGP